MANKYVGGIHLKYRHWNKLSKQQSKRNKQINYLLDIAFIALEDEAIKTTIIKRMKEQGE